ncbi:hypothetical protein [Ammonifex thiophilus]|uniref:Uncharacterized protein n=1 Tax=Ammonifex thiophilus TaxID=444093 RepID=A0A3D8P402_9THEO|nr:hypothetical protein [Ammonifex thiophilus]RDV81780.1 hypothetical protein DXX99_08750 [Ammonifex thiophilus]
MVLTPSEAELRLMVEEIAGAVRGAPDPVRSLCLLVEEKTKGDPQRADLWRRAGYRVLLRLLGEKKGS